MPIAPLPGNLQMYYDDDDFTDPWTEPETVILHHGNAKNARLWYAWVPLLSADYRVIRLDAVDVIENHLDDLLDFTNLIVEAFEASSSS